MSEIRSFIVGKVFPDSSNFSVSGSADLVCNKRYPFIQNLIVDLDLNLIVEFCVSGFALASKLKS